MRSASQSGETSLTQKILYLWKLLRMRQRRSAGEIGRWADFGLIEQCLISIKGGTPPAPSETKLLEIGHGQRPWLLISAHSHGYDAWGIDLDEVTLGFHPLRLLKSWRTNGFERFLKSLARSLLHDHRNLAQLKEELGSRGKRMVVARERFLTGDVARGHAKLHLGHFDLIFSFDVFEHIPREALRGIMKSIDGLLTPEGIAVIQPHIFTGIAGGHDPDFYTHRVNFGTAPANRAWAHLWDPEFTTNTFLNRMRLRDFQTLFEEDFEIIEQIVREPDLGESYFTRALAEKLRDRYSREELLTNRVTFVLKKASRFD